MGRKIACEPFLGEDIELSLFVGQAASLTMQKQAGSLSYGPSLKILQGI